MNKFMGIKKNDFVNLDETDDKQNVKLSIVLQNNLSEKKEEDFYSKK